MVTNLSRTIDELKEHNIWVIATDMDGEQPLSRIDAKTGIAWVLGAEGTGIRRLVKQNCDQVARIPIGSHHDPSTSTAGSERLQAIINCVSSEPASA